MRKKWRHSYETVEGPVFNRTGGIPGVVTTKSPEITFLYAVYMLNTSYMQTDERPEGFRELGFAPAAVCHYKI